MELEQIIFKKLFKTNNRANGFCETFTQDYRYTDNKE